MLDMITTNLNEIVSNPWVQIFASLIAVEVIPIKIYPLRWLRQLIFGDILKKIEELRNELTDVKVQNWRWNVLDFANSCRNGRRHSRDEWQHTIAQLADYEEYIEHNEIINGVFEEDAKFLREEYQEHSKNNDFL
ncbi:MAG: hypothetical protein J6B01_04650 [Ruminococcus sp.]|nr:hypothetical protein [Ruminococcus sp.]